MQYYFFETSGDSVSGDIGDYYDLNLEFRTMQDSMFVKTSTKFKRNPDELNGGLPQAISRMSRGDSAVFIVNIDTFYEDFNIAKPIHLDDQANMKIHIRVVEITDPATFNSQKLEEEKLNIREFIEYRGWNTTLDSSSGIHYEIVSANPEGLKVEYGDDVGVTYNYYTIDEKPIARIKEGDLRQLVVGEKSSIPGLSRAISLTREGESIRAILPFDQAFGADGFRANVPAYATIVIELDIVVVEKPENEENL
jgi:hypothetical protein